MILTPQGKLAGLLVSLFDAGALNHFLKHLVRYGAIVEQLGSPEVMGIAKYAAAVVEALDKDGLIDTELFDALVDAKPGRSTDIAPVRATFASAVNEREVTPSGAPMPSQPRRWTDILPPLSPPIVGRERELALLDAAWADREHCRIVAIEAWAGAGKTTLVASWLHQLHDSTRPPEPHSVAVCLLRGQAGEFAKPPSPFDFLTDALTQLGVNDSRDRTDRNRLERLIQELRTRSIILVLDGLEVYFPDLPIRPESEGATLILNLLSARYHQKSLVIVTSRASVPTVDRLAPGQAQEIHRRSAQLLSLKGLSDEAGATLLRQMGAGDNEAALRATSRSVGGHPLSLQLLAKWPSARKDLREALVDRPPPRNARGWAARAAQLVGSYLDALSDDTERLSLVWLLCLFDRPASLDELVHLCKATGLKGLVGPLNGAKEAELEELGSSLPGCTSCELTRYPGGENRQALQLHPLVSGIAAKRLREQQNADWVAAHRVVFELILSRWLSEDGPVLAYTAPELKALLQAARHGAEGNLHARMVKEVGYRANHQGTTFWANRKLGATSELLDALRYCFDGEISDGKVSKNAVPVPSIPTQMHATLYYFVGFDLADLGQVDACQPYLTRAYELYQDQGAFDDASRVAAELTEHLLVGGKLILAGEVATLAEGFANRAAASTRSSERFSADQRRESAWTARAAVHYCLGHYADARADYEQAERSLADRLNQPDAILASLEGYRYHELLLAMDEHELVLERCLRLEKADAIDEHPSAVGRGYSQLARGFRQLAHGRALTRLGRQTEAERMLDAAVATLRSARRKPYLPLGLAARANLRAQAVDLLATASDQDAIQAELDAAVRELVEARDIASQGGMRLREVDVDFALTRVHWRRQLHGVSTAKEEAPDVLLSQAAAGAIDIGYLRRLPDVVRMAQKGGARPIVALYLHGFLSSPKSSKALTIRKRLEQDRRVTWAPDLHLPLAKFTIQRSLKRIEEALQGWDGDFVLVASSLGGYTAAEFAYQHRATRCDGRLVGLALLAPAFAFRQTILQILPPEQLERWRQEGSLNLNNWAGRFPDASGPLDLTYPFWEDLQERVDFPSIGDLPCIVVHGKDDDQASFESSKAWAKGQPRAKFVPFPCGHSFEGDQLSRAADRVSEFILDLEKRMTLEDLLRPTLACDPIHARMLGAFSLIEYVGVRKIARALGWRSMSPAVLHHIEEEARHARLLLEMAECVSGKPVSGYTEDTVLALPQTGAYPKLVDAAVAVAVEGLADAERQSVAYATTTWLLEKRAQTVYRTYLRLLDEGAGHEGLNRGVLAQKLTQILADEEGHVDFVSTALPTGSRKAVMFTQLEIIEEAAFGQFLDAWQVELGGGTAGAR
jgi:uncharacterized protein